MVQSNGAQRTGTLQAKTPCIEEVLQLLQERDLLPCIWFILSRVGCDNAVLRVQTQEMSVLTAHEQGVVFSAVQQLR